MKLSAWLWGWILDHSFILLEGTYVFHKSLKIASVHCWHLMLHTKTCLFKVAWIQSFQFAVCKNSHVGRHLCHLHRHLSWNRSHLCLVSCLQLCPLGATVRHKAVGLNKKERNCFWSRLQIKAVTSVQTIFHKTIYTYCSIKRQRSFKWLNVIKLYITKSWNVTNK